MGWLFVLGALLLAGCGTGTRAVWPHRYLLTVRAAPAVAPAAGAGVLRLARIEVPAWLAGTGMVYRLQYRHASGIASYADSAWVAPPAQMLHRVLRRSLARSGEWRAVLGPGNPATAEVLLRIRIEDFSQVFTAPEASFGVLDATATLVATHGNTALAQQHFHYRVAAPSADAAGGVAALEQASGEFSAALRAWLARQPQRP